MPTYEQHPKYKVDIEVNPPPKEIFMGLGWDLDRNTNRKHYRRYYINPLEEVKEIFPNRSSPFNSFDLKRGQTRGVKKSGLFSIFKAHK